VDVLQTSLHTTVHFLVLCDLILFCAPRSVCTVAAALLQVEIEIETADKGGTFLGTIVLPGAKPLSLGHALARLGLAKTQQFFDASRVKGGQELLAAIQAAKEARLKVGTRHKFGACLCIGLDALFVGDMLTALGRGAIQAAKTARACSCRCAGVGVPIQTLQPGRITASATPCQFMCLCSSCLSLRHQLAPLSLSLPACLFVLPGVGELEP
jgi:hypothetical protein